MAEICELCCTTIDEFEKVVDGGENENKYFHRKRYEKIQEED